MEISPVNVRQSKTKRSLMIALEKIIEEHSFDNITVRMITDEADVSRQTFYKHFCDKYDLVNWTYGELINESMRRIGLDLGWDEAVVLKLTIMKNKGTFYSEVYKSNDYASLLTNDAMIVHDYYEDLLYSRVHKDTSEDENFLLMLYCHGATRMTARWARTGMVESPESLARLYKIALPSFVKNILFDD